MPDPRSLRFGLGFGVLVFALLLGWVWSGNRAAVGPATGADGPGEPGRHAARSADVHGPEPSAGLRLRAGRTPLARPEAQPAGAPWTGTDGVHPAASNRGRVLFVDAATHQPLTDWPIALIGWEEGTYRTDALGGLDLLHSEVAGTWKLSPAGEFAEGTRLEPSLLWVRSGALSVVQVHQPSGWATLEVRGPTGLAVADATVDLVRQEDGRTQSFQRRSSDASGQLQIPWPPDGRTAQGWVVRAHHREIGASAPTTLTDPAGRPPLILRLEPGLRLELQVLDPTGTPYPGLQLRLRSLALAQNAFVAQLQQAEYLDEQGTAIWDQLAPGDYELAVRSPISVGWKERRLTLAEPVERVDWTIGGPQQPIALEGRLGIASPSSAPARGHYVELLRAQDRSLIAGTRTDGQGRFRLFGEAEGEVLLLTELLDGDYAFPPFEHRFPAGTRAVSLVGERVAWRELQTRIIDNRTGAPIPGAQLSWQDADGVHELSRSNLDGLLEARLHPRRVYWIRAEGYEPLTSEGGRDWTWREPVRLGRASKR